MYVKCGCSGWRLVGWTAAVVGGLILVALAVYGWNESAIGLVLRISARTSFVLFTSAFVASPLRRRWPNALSSWMLENRRYLGVSFAVSHYFHLAAIITLAQMAPESFRRDVGADALIGGGIGYVLLTAMAATSFDRTADWVGARAWRILHTTGIYYIWFVFFFSYVPRSVESLAYLPFVIVLVAAMALRLPIELRRRVPNPGSRADRSRGFLRIPPFASRRD